MVGIVNDDPELKKSEAGESYLRLILAVPYTNQRNNWIPIIFRGKTAENINKLVTKGMTVYVSGYLLMIAGNKKEGKEKTRAYLRLYGTYFKVLCRPNDTNRVPVLPHHKLGQKQHDRKIKLDDMADKWE